MTVGRHTALFHENYHKKKGICPTHDSHVRMSQPGYERTATNKKGRKVLKRERKKHGPNSTLSPGEGPIDGDLEDDQQGMGEALRGIREPRARTSELLQKGTLDLPCWRHPRRTNLPAWSARRVHRACEARKLGTKSSPKHDHYRSSSCVKMTRGARLCYAISAAKHRKRCHPAICTKVSFVTFALQLAGTL